MTSQPRQEPFKQAPSGTISTEQHLTSSPFASPLHEGPCLSPGEGLQEQSRRLQQCVRELLIQNQQLRMLLASANESPSQGASLLNAPRRSEETNHTRGHYESTDASGK
jgi:hypothetical protein